MQRSLWVHSVGTALACRLLAMRNGGALDPEDAFLAGLFHDSGRLMLNHLVPEAFLAAWTETEAGAESVDAEAAIFGLSHDELGYEALTRWELPDPIRVAARDHHQDPAQVDPLTRTVRVADDFVHWLGLLPERSVVEPAENEAPTGGEPVDSPGATSADLSGLDPSRILQLARWLPNRPGSAGAMLGLSNLDVDGIEQRLRLALERETQFFLSGS